MLRELTTFARTVAVFALVLAGCATKSAETARTPVEDLYPGNTLAARFEGHYPCAERNQSEECDRLKVWLFLFTDAETGEPDRFNFGFITVGGDDDSRTIWEGTWTAQFGRPGFPTAELVVLDETVPPIFRRHWRVDDHLLLLLDENGRVRPGHPRGGYSLYSYSMQLIVDPDA